MNKVCPKCNNKRHIFEKGKGWVRCDCIGQLRADRLMSKSGFPDSLWEIDSSAFKLGDDIERKRLAQAIPSLVKQYNKQPVFIQSETPDKELAAAIICRYISIIHEDVKSISYTTIDQLVQRQFGKFTNQYEADPISSDITVISIGREMTNDAHRSNLYSLLYDKILAGKFVIVCSAIPKNRIVQVYRQAVDNLLERYFVFYSC